MANLFMMIPTELITILITTVLMVHISTETNYNLLTKEAREHTNFLMEIF